MNWKNESNWDRVARVVVGLAILVAGWSGWIGGTAGLVCKIAGFVPLATGLVGTCPVYGICGISTRKA